MSTAEQRARRRPRLPDLPALDGIRAFAVAAVLLYHADVSWMPGGFLGVEVFFVLSGYLITSLLWTEWRRTGRLDVIRFWARRARRLLPALFVMLVVVGSAFIVWWPDEVASIRDDIAAAAGYGSNWYLIYGEGSYFETIGRPSAFDHLWSLAVEEQFYILWPLVLIAVAVLAKARARIASTIAKGALASALAAWALFDPAGDPSRVYHGTDTRAAGLLLGAALAVVWRPFARRRPPSPSRGARALLDGVAAGAIVALVASFALLDEFTPWTYVPGIQAVAVVTALLVAAAVHPSSRVARVIGWGPVRAIGRRSYSIYLWHWPVFVVTRPELDVPWSEPTTFAVRIAITAVLAELSFRFVEEPCRRGALGRLWRALRDRVRAVPAAHRRSTAIGWAGTTGLAPALAVSLLVVGLVRADPPPPPISIAESRESERVEPPRHEPGGGSLVRVERQGRPGVWSGHANAPRIFVRVGGGRVVAVGDSVMLGARGALERTVERIVVNAALSRRVGDGVALLQRWAREDRLGPAVVIHLGNNGVFRPYHLEDIMRALRDVPRVVILNVRVYRYWQRQVNQMLAERVERYPNAVLLDWYNLSVECAGRTFWPDGIHLRDNGLDCYAQAIADALAPPD